MFWITSVCYVGVYIMNFWIMHVFFWLALRHCLKSVRIRSFSWSVFSCIQSKYRKIRTRKSSVFGHFSRSECNKLTKWKEKISFSLQIRRRFFGIAFCWLEDVFFKTCFERGFRPRNVPSRQFKSRPIGT